MSRSTRPFHRRRLLQGAAGLSLAATVGGLTGCESAVSRNRGPQATGGEPVRGGTASLGILADLIPGNLLTNSTTGITTVVGLAFDSLIRYPNDRVEPTPRLATAWELAADGLSLTLDLRDDVTFHTGRAFTSKDVEFSLRAYADPRWTAQLRSTAAAISSYDTSAPHRVVLGFDHPLGNVFDLLDTAPILDSETAERLRPGEQIAGTGPFRVASWTPGSAIRFERHEGYWQPGRPYLDAVDAQVITDPKALLAALRSGQVQLANGLGSLDVQTLTQGGDGFSEIRLEGAEQQLYVGSNVTATPLDDLRLRRAIAFALDRERVVEEVLRGSGYPVNLPWPRYSPAYDETLNTTFTRDLAQAKALVAEVGRVPELPLTYNPTPVQTALAAVVQSDLAEVGIPVRLDPVDGAQFVKQLIGAQFEALWIATHSWAQYTPSTLTVSAYPFNAHQNASRFTDAGYTSAADTAWEVIDGRSAEAVAAYQQVSEQLLEHAFLAEISVLLPQWVTAERLQGVSYTKRAELQLTDAWLG